jgi:AmiR/NasT family two-component response regulator
MAAELDELARFADAQEQKATQLQTALESRVVIEQAVGMLAERFDLSVTEGFTLLRHASRDSRRQLRALATELTQGRTTPAEITAARLRS